MFGFFFFVVVVVFVFLGGFFKVDLQLAFGVCFEIDCRSSGFFQIVKYCKKKSPNASHDALFIACSCKNSSDDCQPGLNTKIDLYE